MSTQHEAKIGWRLIACVILPFSCGYLISYLFRTVNSVIAPISSPSSISTRRVWG